MREKASRRRTGPCCPLAKREADGSVETRSRTLPSSPFWDPEEKETALLLKFWEQNKKETKDSPPGPPPGEGVVRSPSPEEQDPKAPGRPSQGRRLPWRFMGLAGAEAGCAGLLRPAPRCGHSAGGAAAGGGVETAADRRGRM